MTTDIDELTQDFLEHFGTKGMKWGVRKDYKKAAQNYNAKDLEAAARFRSTYDRGISESDYKNLDTKDISIAKGSTISRVTKNPNDEGTGFRYVSVSKEDAERYKAVIPTFGTNGVASKAYQQHYEVTYKATEKLKSPSEKERVDAYIRIMDKKDIHLKSGEVIDGREYMRRAGLGDTVSHLKSRELALRYYGQIISQQGIRDEPMNSAYFRELQKKGYNALIDDNNRRFLSDTPMLALEPKNSLSTVNVRPLTNKEIHNAQASMTLPQYDGGS